MVDQVADDNTTTASDDSREIRTANDLAKLQNDGKPLSTRELKELNARIKAFEEMAKLEDRLRALENRKRPRASESALPENLTAELRSIPENSRNSSSRPPTIRPSIEIDNSDSDSNPNSDSSLSDTTSYRRHKRQQFTKGMGKSPSKNLSRPTGSVGILQFLPTIYSKLFRNR